MYVVKKLFLGWFRIFQQQIAYHKVSSSNMSRLEAHADFFRLLMKGILNNPYLL